MNERTSFENTTSFRPKGEIIISEVDRKRFDKVISEVKGLINQKKTASPQSDTSFIREFFIGEDGKKYVVTFELAEDKPLYIAKEGEIAPLSPVITRLSIVFLPTSLDKVKEEWTVGETRPEGEYFLQYGRDLLEALGHREPVEFRTFNLANGEGIAYDPGGQQNPDTISRFEQILIALRKAKPTTITASSAIYGRKHRRKYN